MICTDYQALTAVLWAAVWFSIVAVVITAVWRVTK